MKHNNVMNTATGWELEDVVARVFDSAAIALCAIASTAILPIGTKHIIDVPLLALANIVALLLFPVFGIYRSWRGRSKLRLIATVTLAWFVVLCMAYALRSVAPEGLRLSASWLACWAISTGVLLTAARLAGHAMLNRLRRSGRNLRNVALVGAGQHRDDVLRRLELASDSGFRAAVVLDTDALDKSNLDVELDAFVRRVENECVAEIWLALSILEGPIVCALMERFRDQFVNIRLMPNVRSLTPLGGDVVDLLGTPAVNLMASPSPRALLGKAIFDRLFACVVLIALAPLFLAIALAIKCTSNGPVIFKQRRKGVNGCVFNIFKFRTMRIHAEESGRVTQATRDDPRVTRIGAFLRRTSLDELPQFFNVLCGEMSVVGPRPHALAHDDLYQHLVGGYIHRYRIKPGITGWAQIKGFRGETEFLEKMQGRVDCDLYYLRNWSYELDLQIILGTILKGFRDRDAY